MAFVGRTFAAIRALRTSEAPDGGGFRADRITPVTGTTLPFANSITPGKWRDITFCQPAERSISRSSPKFTVSASALIIDKITWHLGSWTACKRCMSIILCCVGMTFLGCIAASSTSFFARSSSTLRSDLPGPRVIGVPCRFGLLSSRQGQFSGAAKSCGLISQTSRCAAPASGGLVQRVTTMRAVSKPISSRSKRRLTASTTALRTAHWTFRNSRN